MDAPISTPQDKSGGGGAENAGAARPPSPQAAASSANIQPSHPSAPPVSTSFAPPSQTAPAYAVKSHSLAPLIILAAAFLFIGSAVAAGWYYYDQRAPARRLSALPSAMYNLKSFQYRLNLKLSTLPEENKDKANTLLKRDGEKGSAGGIENKSGEMNPGAAKKEPNQSAWKNPSALAAGMVGIFDERAGKNTKDLIDVTLDPACGCLQRDPYSDRSQKVETEVRLSGIVEQADKDTVNFSNQFDFSVQAGNFRPIGVAAEVRKINQDYYLQLVEFPDEIINYAGLSPDLNPLNYIKVKDWYSVKTGTLEGLGELSKEFIGGTKPPKALDAKFAEKLKNANLFDISEVKRDETYDGNPVFRYALKLKADGAEEVIRELSRYAEDREPTKAEEADLKSFITQAAKGTIQIWVDKDSRLRKLALSVPQYESDGEKMNLEINAALSEFNGAHVEIPKNSKPFDDDLKKITQIFVARSEKDGRDRERISDMIAIQDAAEAYRGDRGYYPRALSDLAPDYLASVPEDPLDSKFYAYVSGWWKGAPGKPDLYLLGVSLEAIDNYELQNDFDCNARTGAKCGEGDYDQSAAFSGSDAKGCKGEENRYCLDFGVVGPLRTLPN